MRRGLIFLALWSIPLLEAAAQGLGNENNRRYAFGQHLGNDFTTELEYFKDEAYLMVARIDTGVGSNRRTWIGLSVLDISLDKISERRLDHPVNFFSINTSHGNHTSRVSDGYLVLTSVYDSTSLLSGYLFKLNEQLDTIWTRLYSDGQASFTAQELLPMSDGFSLVGTTFSTPSKGMVYRLDNAGNEQWSATVGSPEYSYSIHGGVRTSDDGMVLVGNRRSSNNVKRAIAIRLSSTGEVIWEQPYTAFSHGDVFQSIIALSSGGFVMVGASDTIPGWVDRLKQYVVRINEAGDTLWTKLIDEPASNNRCLWDLIELPDGNLIAVGMIDLETSFSWKGSVTKLSSDGEVLWHNWYQYTDSTASASNGWLMEVMLDRDPNYILCAGTLYPVPFSDPVDFDVDSWLIRLDMDGCLVPGCNLVTGINTQYVGMGEALRLQPSYALHDTAHRLAKPDEPLRPTPTYYP